MNGFVYPNVEKYLDGSTPRDVSKAYPIPTGDFWEAVAHGDVAGHSIIHKFGSALATTTLKPISLILDYQTPTAPVALEVVSDAGADATGGIGATKITVVGLDANWDEVIQVIDMAGVTPVAIPTSLFRLYRWYVSESGSYATSTVGSHVGNLSIQVAGAGAVWSTIPIVPLARGQSEIAAYTIPIGFTGYLVSKSVHVASTKICDFYFFQRPNADDVITPYTGTFRITELESGVDSQSDTLFRAPKGPHVGPCDIGFMAKMNTGSAVVSAEFELLLIQDGF